ncbi:MAG: hypothetical protein H6Q58_520 [Firmicutes bacterium]|nr:hypothetical protein [Bacillota bacterium]
MKTKMKFLLAMLIPSCIIWFIGYGLIIAGNKAGYAIEIIGAILSYMLIIKLIIVLITKKKVRFLLITILTIYFSSDILLNSYYSLM